MTTAGPLITGAATTVIRASCQVWVNPGNAQADDSSFATCVIGVGAGLKESYYLDCQTFGFAIPSGATIDGITVSARGKSTSAIVGSDARVQMMKAGVLAGTEKTPSTTWGTTENTHTFGAVNDLWGTTWTPAQINAAGFGVSYVCSDGGSSSGCTVSIDYIDITITYTIKGHVIVVVVGA